MFVVNGNPIEAIEVEYNVSIDVLFASFKHLAAAKSKQREHRRELYDIIATAHGMKFEWEGASATAAKSNKPKSNAEFEMRLSQMGFKVKEK